ncbi:MAG: hypothetical protein ABJM58_03965 [Alteripontixanthobacter sp.]
MAYAPSPSQLAAQARIEARKRERRCGDSGQFDATPSVNAHHPNYQHPAEPPALSPLTRYDPYEESALPVAAEASGFAGRRDGGVGRSGDGPPQNNLGILIEELPGDETRAAQAQFTLDLRIAFLETLAANGSVRASALRARVSHQSDYRAQRGSAAFGRAWDAALVVAREQAEAKLADCALNGVQEEVWFHGDLVGPNTLNGHAFRRAVAAGASGAARQDLRCDQLPRLPRLSALSEGQPPARPD